MRCSTRAVVAVGLAAMLAGACSIKEQKTPDLSGPSSFGLSISATAYPTAVMLDGSSRSDITVQAMGPTGQPESVLFDVTVSPTGYGEVTESQITTGTTGRTTVAFIAGTTPVITTGMPTSVVVILSPAGAATGQVTRRVTIGISPQGGPNTAPTAAFTYVPDSPQVGLAVKFDAGTSTDEGTACGSNCTYAWDFGDGSTATGQTASHTYTIANTYAVKLTATDARGAAGTVTRNVVVTAATVPVAAFTFLPATPEIGATVTFDGSTSTYDGKTCGANCTFAWDFGDGSTGSGVTATHAYSTAKSYVVKLTVTESHGAANSVTKAVTVTATAPTASFTTNPISPVGIFQEVTFNAAGSTAAAGRTISSYAWEFGDGGTGSGVNDRHTYSVAGTYTVTLVVTDSAGIQGRATASIVVNVGVTASFTYSPTDPVRTAGEATVYFNAEGSQGSPGFGGRNAITEYIWDFGNSETTVTTTTPITSTTYTTANIFTVTLTVVDSAGRRATTSKTVTVK